MNLLECASQAEWRDWLQNHHTSENEIWLVFYKKESGRASLSYLDTLDEALCVGWIDSLIKKTGWGSLRAQIHPAPRRQPVVSRQ